MGYPDIMTCADVVTICLVSLGLFLVKSCVNKPLPNAIDCRAVAMTLSDIYTNAEV